MTVRMNAFSWLLGRFLALVLCFKFCCRHSKLSLSLGGEKKKHSQILEDCKLKHFSAFSFVDSKNPIHMACPQEQQTYQCGGFGPSNRTCHCTATVLRGSEKKLLPGLASSVVRLSGKKRGPRQQAPSLRS